MSRNEIPYQTLPYSVVNMQRSDTG